MGFLANEVHNDQVKNKVSKEKVGKGALLVPRKLGFVLRVDLKSKIHTKNWKISSKKSEKNLKKKKLPKLVTQLMKPARKALKGKVPTRQQ